MSAPTSIQCLACGGKGYVTRIDYRGLPFPVRCGGCGGTGTQTVRS